MRGAPFGTPVASSAPRPFPLVRRVFRGVTPPRVRLLTEAYS